MTIHEARLNAHPFVNPNAPKDLEFVERRGEIVLEGQAHCQRNTVLEVDVSFHVRYSGSLMRVRPYSFRYVAWVRGGNLVLKYHNVHTRDDDYHHRVYNPLTGRQVFHEELNRIQFPQLSEVLDEMEIITRPLET